MNLLAESRAALGWVGKVMAAFLGSRLWTTLALIASVTVGRVASLLAFMLPLKVILLAGSDGVPRYFRFFVDPEYRMEWIIGLSCAAVGFYVLSLLMDSASKRLSEAGSQEVLAGANEIAVTSRQREEAQNYYSDFSSIAANGLLALMGFSAIGWLNPLLFWVLFGLMAVQYTFTGLVLHLGDALNPGATHRMIQRNTGGYLAIFTSINFLAGFFVLLIPFVMGQGGNLIVAIITFLVMRQCFSSVTDAITTTASLWGKRPRVEPMIFRDKLLQQREMPVVRDLRDVFDKTRRDSVAAERLPKEWGSSGQVETEWLDSPIKGAYTLIVKTGEASEDHARMLEYQAFPPRSLHLLEHEEFLFERMGREVLLAPLQIARFQEGPFECQIGEYGTARHFGARAWKNKYPELLEYYWSVAPARELVNAFRTSTPTLDGRLTEGYLERLMVALDRPEEVRAYETLMAKLPKLQQRLSEIPLYLYNPDLDQKTVVTGAEGSVLVTAWGRWALEPIGALLPTYIGDDRLEAMLARVRVQRGLSERHLTIDHAWLAHESWELEREIGRVKYKGALRRLARLLRNDLLALSGDSLGMSHSPITRRGL